MKRQSFLIVTLILLCMGLSSRAFADYTDLSTAIMGTSDFSTTTNNWTIGSNISTTTTSSSKYAVYNTSANITGSTSGRVTGTIAIIINVPETTTAQEIFSYTYISGTTSTTSYAVGLGINASRQLVGYWNGSAWSSTSTIDISAGEHIVVFKTGNDGSFIYVDNSSTYIQMSGLKTTATGKNGFEFGFTDYIEEFYCFDSDIDAGNLFNALTSYTITCNSPTGGSIEASSTSERPGRTITLSNTPNTGYKLSTLTVTDATSATVETTKQADGTYTFTMPASDVSVTATFTSSVATPTFSPADGTTFSTSTLDVTIDCATDGATIYYTQDGTDPSSESNTNRQTYTKAITLTTSNTIRAIAVKGSYTSEEAKATYTKVLPSSSITYTSGTVNVNKGETLTTTTTTVDGYDGNVTYTSSNTNIATVSDDGTITGVAAGYATITATASGTSNYSASTASLKVHVIDPESTVDLQWEGQAITTEMLISSASNISNANTIYLYNKGNGKYLSYAGHWGTEGILTDNPTNLWLNGTLSDKNLACIYIYSKNDLSTWWGWVTPAMARVYDNRGFFMDASDNYDKNNEGTLQYDFTFNEDDNSYSISPKDAVGSIEISYDDNGTTKYLTTDGSAVSWSAEEYSWAYNNGKIYTIDNNSNTIYLYFNDTSLGVTTTETTLTVDDNNHITNSTYYIAGGFTTVSASPETYAIATLTVAEDGEGYYLTYQNDGSERNDIISVKPYPSNSVPDEARWLIVTKKDFLAKISSASDENATQADATYYVTNPSILRNETQGWDSDVTTGTIAGGYFRVGNSLFATAGPTAAITSTTYLENADDVQTTTYGGNGNGYTVTENDTKYTSLAEGSSTYYNNVYGGYYSARLLAASGKAYQTITGYNAATAPEGLKAGWYKVTAEAYVFKSTDDDVTALMYAKSSSVSSLGTSYATSALKASANYMPMTDAAIAMDDGTGTYDNSVMVYLKEGDNLEIGFSIAGGTLSGKTGTSTMLGFDNVHLYYCGDASIIVLDEDWTDDSNISSQISADTKNTARTLALKRKIKDNIWNSLVLPVTISAQGLKAAFGENVKLCEFDKSQGSVIYFKNVDLTTSSNTAIKPGQIYIVKPQGINSGNCYTSGSWTSVMNSKTIEASTTVPVFLFSQVSMDDYVDPVFSNPFDANDTKMCVKGTYIALTNEIGPDSYAINADDGKWYHWVGNGKLSVKGYRGWISPYDDGTSDDEGGSGDELDSKELTFVVDGEEMEETASKIKGVEEYAAKPDCNNVYSIDGRKVGTNIKNINSLKKGIYIFNGVKFVVK